VLHQPELQVLQNLHKFADQQIHSLQQDILEMVQQKKLNLAPMVREVINQYLKVQEPIVVQNIIEVQPTLERQQLSKGHNSKEVLT